MKNIFLSATVISLLVILSVLFSANLFFGDLRAEAMEETKSESGDDSGFKPGIVPVALSLCPGIVIHGSGHFAAGDTKTAKNLLVMEGAGLGLLFGGITLLALSGASEGASVPSILAAGSGLSLFFESWLLDVYGAAGIAAGSSAPAPLLNIRAGYSYVYDPQFLYRNMLSLESLLRIGRFGINPFYTFATDDDNYFTGLRLSYRIWSAGAGDNARAYDRSYIDVTLGGSYRHYGSEFFSIWTGEIFLGGRCDMVRMSKTLKGSFLEAGFGFGRGYYDYDVPGVKFGEDKNDILLMRFGFGFYLGERGGEFLFFYDHRRDEYVGGLGLSGVGSGFMGYMGLKVSYFPLMSFGGYAEFFVGSAYVFNLGIQYRM